MPTWAVLLSLVPVGLFAAAMFGGDRSPVWGWVGHLTRLGRERATGLLWIVTGANSLAWVLGLTLVRKRWAVWVAAIGHGLMVAFTIFPGTIAITFLMHWGRGPGW